LRAGAIHRPTPIGRPANTSLVSVERRGTTRSPSRDACIRLQTTHPAASTGSSLAHMGILAAHSGEPDAKRPCFVWLRRSELLPALWFFCLFSGSFHPLEVSPTTGPVTYPDLFCSDSPAAKSRFAGPANSHDAIPSRPRSRSPDGPARRSS
jgi:hypothetical protein